MILAIDIGGTNVKMGLVDHNGKIHAFSEAAANFDEYKTPILSTVLRQSKLFIKRAQARIEGIAVSATGQIDTCTGTVIGGNGSIPYYIGSQIKKTLEDEFSVNAWVLNDANAAVLGECFAGRARGLQNVLMLTLGTGVGGGLVLNGEIYINGERQSDAPFGMTIQISGVAEEPVTLGDNEYFVMGDNVNNSEDSRYTNVGNIAKTEITGKVVRILLPSSDKGKVR